jgi:hypothetical protein
MNAYRFVVNLSDGPAARVIDRRLAGRRLATDNPATAIVIRGRAAAVGGRAADALP